MRPEQKAAEVVGRHFGAAHRPLLVSNACISGVSAIVIAARLIRSGRYDHVFVAGFDLLCDFIVSGFNAFKSVSLRRFAVPTMRHATG